MSGKVCYEKLPHTCGTNNGMQVWQHEDGSFDGFCFSCGTYVKDPYGDSEPPTKRLKIKTPEEIESELQEISELQAHDLPERKLTRRVLNMYGVKVALSEYDGVTPVAAWYPYYKPEDIQKISGYKCKTSAKNIFSKGDQRGTLPFGWNVAVRGDRYKLFITEGEDDALALFRSMMQHGKWKKYPAVVSLSHGAGGAAECIDRVRSQVQRMFKEVVLVFDQDDAGRKAVSDVAKLIPGVKVTSLPMKDANDMVIAGRGEELYRAAMWESTAKISGQSYRSSEVWHLAEETPEMGLPWPWPSLTDLTRGRRRGEVIYFGAG